MKGCEGEVSVKKLFQDGGVLTEAVYIFAIPADVSGNETRSEIIGVRRRCVKIEKV